MTGVRYSWTFGDGVTDSGPNVTHVYASAGVYIVTCTGSKNGWNPDTDSMTIQID